jgi:hypothetical protein
MEAERIVNMQNHKWHFVLTSVILFFGLLLATLAFGRDYSSEPVESSAEAAGPSHRVPTKASPQVKRSVVTYSTEDISESPSETEAHTTVTSTRDHTVPRTRMVPDTPRKPETPNMPETPEGDGYYYGGVDPVVGGTMHFRPGPYLARRHGVRRAFWPGLLDTDISYSWSGNSGHGELTYWPYGYRYSWGGNPAYSDAPGCYHARPAIASEPNTTNRDYKPDQPSDANELLPEVPVPEVAAQPKHKAVKDR